MYKLYGYVPDIKLLKVSFDEGVIIDEIGKHIYKTPYIHFMIVKQTEDRMIPYKSILSEKDYFDYMADYIANEENGYSRKRELK